MKYNLIFIAAVFMVAVAWVTLNKVNYPAPPEKYTRTSKTVNLKFKVSANDLNSVELALNEGRGANNLFIVFDLSDQWMSGKFGMILKGMSESSLLKGSSGKKPDISRFEKDNNGKKINFYSFDQVIVTDERGDSYMQMQYVGPPMPLIESLKIEKNITLPRNIVARFEKTGNIEFVRGDYGLDKNINGFWIPVKISK